MSKAARQRRWLQTVRYKMRCNALAGPFAGGRGGSMSIRSDRVRNARRNGLRGRFWYPQIYFRSFRRYP